MNTTPSGRHQRGAPDHPHHAWSPLPSRAPRRFANGAAVAICPIIAFETHEDAIPEGWPQPNWLAGGVGRRPDPNIARIGQREYGMRAGWPRLSEALLASGMRFGAAIDALSAESLPELRADVAADVVAGRAEWIAHGLSVNRPIYDAMDVDAELAYLAETRARLAAVDIHPRGWFGIEYGESSRTPKLVARAGFDYILDWCNDEQPYRMSVPQGSLIALTPMADLDDAFALCAPRGITPASYARNLLLAAEGLARDGRRSARTMIWVMRPFLSGQAFRIDAIAEAFAAMARLPGVWFATPSAILEQIAPIE